ncbi:MAG: hypothetical protein IKV41_02645 [Oscillospiraceae bacterium]|nr:hypothetical protein [Oscillospiraceae bacterium]
MTYYPINEDRFRSLQACWENWKNEVEEAQQLFDDWYEEHATAYYKCEVENEMGIYGEDTTFVFTEMPTDGFVRYAESENIKWELSEPDDEDADFVYIDSFAVPDNVPGHDHRTECYELWFALTGNFPQTQEEIEKAWKALFVGTNKWEHEPY